MINTEFKNNIDKQINEIDHSDIKEKSSLSIYLIIKNFKNLIDSCPPSLELFELSERIQDFSENKIIFYQTSNFGSIKKIFSIIRNFFILGQWCSSGELGKVLSLNYSQQIKEKLNRDVTAYLNNNHSKYVEIYKQDGKSISASIASEFKQTMPTHNQLDKSLSALIDLKIEIYINNIQQELVKDINIKIKNKKFNYLINNNHPKHFSSLIDTEIANYIIMSDENSLNDFLIQFPLFAMDKGYDKEKGDAWGDVSNAVIERVEFLQKQFSSQLEESPILAAYQSHSRALNPTHLNWYGEGEEAQNTYHIQQKETVKYTLSVMKNKTCSFGTLSKI